jgi:hypothetical protein
MIIAVTDNRQANMASFDALSMDEGISLSVANFPGILGSLSFHEYRGRLMAGKPQGKRR